MTTCPSCGVAGNNLSCPNHSYWGINPLPDSIPMPEQSAWASFYAAIGRLNVLLNERNKEIERLKSLMPPDERGPGFVGQGSWSVFAEKVVAERDALREILTDLREKGIIDQHNRPLPLEGHHKDCGHGKNGWSMCTCDELKKADEERSSKQFKDLVEEGQNLRKEFDQKTAGMRGPPRCSKCGDTGLVQVAPNARGVKQCDCKRTRTSPIDQVIDDLMKDDRETCDHGNTECKRCGVGQPARDHHQDLKVGDIVRFEVEGVITDRQTGGIVKDYDGNDYEPVQYVVRETLSGNKCHVPYYQILAVIGEDE